MDYRVQQMLYAPFPHLSDLVFLVGIGQNPQGFSGLQKS
ncbi:hypothetical protein YPPY66_3318 [Yersinia pestis PY-66]|nr:hypothetical protein YPPY54_3147 [Yersinia pestis PY-54]EIS71977.1 hypothetical protein YPPY66_3318 [Yersinia pestis PY-66]EIT56386.1 hypothetical protein YPPY103_3209 [Yersinia pestis PY-103]